MLTIKLKIKDMDSSVSETIKQFQSEYSCAFRKLYSNYNQPNYKELSKTIELKYNLNSWFMASLQYDVKTKHNQVQTQKIQKENQILDITKQLTIQTDKRKIYRLKKKLTQLDKSLSKNIVFGGLNNLRQISYLSNIQRTIEEEQTLNELKNVYKQLRLMPICSVGEGPKQGNRFFQIQDDDKILFKPNKSTKILLEVYGSKSQLRLLNRLKDQMNNCLQPVSFKLSTEYLWISYDEQKLNDYHFNETEWSKELKEHPKSPETKEIRSQITKKWYKEQEARQLYGKLKNRYISVDLNPKFIGYSICDYKDEKQVIIDKGCFDLSNHSTKLSLSSTDKKQIYQNNKRKYEISIVWKQIFKLAKHFKCGYFVIEELNFKPEIVNDSAKEGNRQTKNIWHRTLTTNLIKKHCSQTGIQLVEVNPVYSSFIGNLMYEYFDPVNASLEINRRGYFKFIKDNFYPELNLVTALNTMSSINNVDVRDVLDVEELNSVNSWKQLFTLSKQTKLKYRWALNDLKDPFKVFSLNNIKSKTILYCF